jgi:hypothetical protein
MLPMVYSGLPDSSGADPTCYGRRVTATPPSHWGGYQGGQQPQPLRS